MKKPVKTFDLTFEQHEKLVQLRCDEFAIKFVEWLTSKDGKYGIMYGGTPELKKDYRFAGYKRDYTIKELLNKFKKTLHANK